MEKEALQNLVNRLKQTISDLNKINLDSLINILNNIEGFNWLEYLQTYLNETETIIDEINARLNEIDNTISQAAMDLNTNAVS